MFAWLPKFPSLSSPEGEALPALEFDPLEASYPTVCGLLVLTALVALGEIWVPELGPTPTNAKAMANTFICVHQVSSGCLGALALYLLLPRKKKELAMVLVLGGLLEAAFMPMRLEAYRTWYPALLATGAGLGLAAMGAIAWRAARASGRERKLALTCLLLAPLFPLGSISGAWLSRIAHLAQPLVYDTWAYAMDCCYGFSPSFLLSSIVTLTPTTSWAFYSVYSHLSLFMVIAAGLCLTRGKADGVYFNALVAFSTAAIAGSLMYNLWPLTGPGNLFGSRYHGDGFIPWNSPPISVDFRPLEAPIEFSRRAMPSMHATFCLLAALTMVRNRHFGFRAFAWTFFIMTLISAAYVGHYFIDFVVALPLTLVNLGLTGRRRLTTSAARIEAMLLGLATLAICYYGFLFAADYLATHPATIIAFELAIVLGFLIAERRLAHSGQRPE